MTPAIISQCPEDVAEVRAEEGYRLYVRFFDGTRGYVEMRDRVLSSDPRPYGALANASAFANVGIGFGTVMWANGLDLAPERDV